MASTFKIKQDGYVIPTYKPEFILHNDTSNISSIQNFDFPINNGGYDFRINGGGGVPSGTTRPGEIFKTGGIFETDFPMRITSAEINNKKIFQPSDYTYQPLPYTFSDFKQGKKIHIYVTNY